jgi:hypothetical protein
VKPTCAWRGRCGRTLQVSLAGQNLLHARHAEASQPPIQEYTAPGISRFALDVSVARVDARAHASGARVQFAVLHRSSPMRVSEFYLVTLKEAPAEAEVREPAAHAARRH